MQTLHVDFPLLATFSWFAWVGSITPGPNTALALATAANFGARTIGPHMLGVAIGFAAMMGFTLAGAHGLLAASPAAGIALRWLGIAYLCWLGLQIARSRGFNERRAARPPRVHESVLLQFANAKAWMLIAGSVGAYQELASPKWLGSLLIVTIFVGCCMIALVVWAWLGSTMRHWLARGSRLAWFNGFLGASLVATAAWIALN